MRRPRVKFDHQPVRYGDDRVQIGGIIYGISAELPDPDGWAWALLEALDGTRTVGQVVADLTHRFPGHTDDEVRGDIDRLVNAGYLEEADDSAPHGLTNRERERYDRSRALFHWMDLTPRVSSWDAQLRLRQSRVVVVGVGGVGCSAALALAVSGVGHLHCVEPDVVELSNLNRQILYTEADIGKPKVDVALERLRQHNSDITITGEQTRIDSIASLKELAAAFDVLVLCADQPSEIRSWANRACCATGTAWVHGGYNGPQLNIGIYYPGTGPCYDCMLIAQQKRRAKLPLRTLWAPAATMPGVHAANMISAGVTGNLAAHATMSLITGAPALRTNRQFALNLATMDYSFSTGPRRPRADCPTCRPSES